MADGALETNVAVENTEVTKTTDESQNTSAATENTENLEDHQAFADKFEGETISKTAFLDRLNKVSSKSKEATQRITELENEANEMAYLKEFEQIIVNDPEKEKAIIEIMKAQKEEKEEVDPLDVVKSDLQKFKEDQQSGVYQGYTNEFKSLAEMKFSDAAEEKMIVNLVQNELDTNFKGWRKHHMPGLVGKAYNNVQDNMDKYLNNKKKEYINNKISDTTPEIGKGAVGTTSERIPLDDDEAFAAWTEKEMKAQIQKGD